MSIRVSSAGVSIERVTTLLSSIPGAVPAAVRSALKRAGDTATAQSGRFVAAEYHISQGTFNANSKQRTKQESSASLSVRFSGRVLPLLTFHTRYSRGGLMYAKVRRDSGGGTLRHVFTANLGYRLGAYERVGRERFPVEAKYGPSTAHMMQNKDVVKEMDETIAETYDKRIEHEITRILSGYGR